MTNELAVTAAPSARESFLPVMEIDDVLRRHGALMQFKNKVLRDGVDFGTIPGTGDKPTLLKPGAEKLCTLFGLTTRFEIVTKVERFIGNETDPEPFFYYHYRCLLSRGDYLIAQGDGSANSHESKYRWRKSERTCPSCGQPSIIKGKAEYGGGWLCFAKKGGCGAKFKNGDASIESQSVGRVPNPDIADLANTLLKMSQKRALVAATLVGVNASEFFTQDIEDFAHGGEASGNESGGDAPQSAPPRDVVSVPETASAELRDKCEKARQNAISANYRTPSGAVPEPLPGGASVRKANAVLQFFENWLQQHPPAAAPPAPAQQNEAVIEGEVIEAPVADCIRELDERFAADARYGAFCKAAQSKGLGWNDIADIAAFEVAFRDLTGLEVPIKEFNGNDWEQAAEMVASDDLAWKVAPVADSATVPEAVQAA